MALWKFQCNVTNGILECNIKYRGAALESTGALANGAFTRNFDDTVANDQKCIRELEVHKTFDPAAGPAGYVQTFTKVAV